MNYTNDYYQKTNFIHIVIGIFCAKFNAYEDDFSSCDHGSRYEFMHVDW